MAFTLHHGQMPTSSSLDGIGTNVFSVIGSKLHEMCRACFDGSQQRHSQLCARILTLSVSVRR